MKQNYKGLVSSVAEMLQVDVMCDDLVVVVTDPWKINLLKSFMVVRNEIYLLEWIITIYCWH